MSSSIKIGVACPIPGERAAFLEWLTKAGSLAEARALAAESLLHREGHPSTRSLGVRFDDGRQLRAHAWVESGGIAVAGGDDAAHYHPLAARREP